MPVGAVLAMIAAANANRQVTEYKNWKRAWDALGGARATRSKTHWGIYICTPIWMLTGAIIFSLDHDHPDRAVAIVCFAVVSTCLFIWIWYRDYRQKNPSRARPRKEALVAISLSVPRKSPGAKDIYKGLPGYCTRLNQG